MMASDVEDTDLDALRSAVLASLKPRGNKDSDEEKGSKNDAELEELRKAALRSKRFAESNNKTVTKSILQSNIQTNRGFRADFANRTNHNARPNLIVIQPVLSDETTSNSSFTINDRSNNESSNSMIPQRGKSSGKFSRFESDSESSEDDSEDDLSNEDVSDERVLDTNDEAENGDEERETQDTDDDDDDNESVLLLHPDDEFPDSECTLLCSNSNVEINADNSITSMTSQLDSPVKLNVKDDICGTESRDEPRRSGKFSRHSERQTRTELRSIKENNDGRSRSERTLEGSSRNGDRRHRRDGHDARKERRKRKVTSDESLDRRLESHRTKNGKERFRDKSRNVDDSDTANSERRSKFYVVGDDRMPSVVVTSRFRRREHRSDSIERETVESSPKDSSRSSFGDSKVLRSRNSSPSSQPLDLREKLRLRKRNKEGKEGFEKDGSEGGEDRNTSNEEDDDSQKKRSLTERDRTVVRSVLSVVKVTPASSDGKSRSRSPLSTRERRTKSLKAVRRKSNSLIEIDRTSKSRRIIINDRKSASRVKEHLNSPQIDIIITDDTVKRSRDPSPIHRIPVRQRLGVPPNALTATNIRGSSPSSRHCSTSPHMLTERRSTSPSSTTSGRSQEPKRKVKLRRDAFAPSSMDLKHELSSGKSRIKKGRPTFENELDEKIRRIQANNEAILKRKYEIAWDQHKHH